MLFANPFGLDPETRLFYLQIYERHPDLNIAEQRLLARAGRVQVDVVEAFCKSAFRPFHHLFPIFPLINAPPSTS